MYFQNKGNVFGNICGDVRKNKWFSTTFPSPPLFRHLYHCNLSQDSAVGIATGYGLDERGVGVRVPGKVKNFLFSTS
jgi:hypothetical protein